MKKRFWHFGQHTMVILFTVCLGILLSQVYAQYVAVGTPTRVISETFTVAVVVNNIEDLYTWQAKVTFDPDVMMVLDVARGEFLSSNALTVNATSLDYSSGESQHITVGDSIFVFSTKDVELGVLLIAGSRIGDVAGASGSGTLATITFGVFGQGSRNVQLEETMLLDSNGNPIQQISIFSLS